MAGPWNATLHHLPDTGTALRRLSQLVRPGGTLAIVGFTRTEWRDWPWALISWTCLGAANRVRGKWEHTAPKVWPPRDTFRELRGSLREALPGASISRLLLGRYLIIWQAPGSQVRGGPARSGRRGIRRCGQGPDRHPQRSG